MMISLVWRVAAQHMLWPGEEKERGAARANVLIFDLAVGGCTF